jgi:arabinose-5-phosphate isomerase
MARAPTTVSTPPTRPQSDPHAHAPAEEVAFIASVLRAEAQAVGTLADRIGPAAVRAVDIMDRCTAAGGSVLVTGLGKSGIVGAKISATLASLGAPSHVIHPAEAVHGDLGRIRASDCLLALSNSGETDEVVTLASILRQDRVPIVSITGGEGASTLARLSTVNLPLGLITEASSFSLAPTCSTTATLALGDALALALAHRRALTADDFAKHHPGGTLGGLLRPVVDVLRFRVGESLTVVEQSHTVRQALEESGALGRRPGAVLIVGEGGRLVGIFTDGDLRRLVLKTPEKLDGAISEVMTRSPRTLAADALVRDAVRLVREFRADEIPVVDDAGRPIGLLDVQDLVALKVVRDD